MKMKVTELNVTMTEENYSPPLNSQANSDHLFCGIELPFQPSIERKHEIVGFFNRRIFSDRVFWALLLDCAGFADLELMAAMGIDLQGEKQLLGLQEGSPDNLEDCVALLHHLKRPGLIFAERITSFIDTSSTLKVALEKVFGSNIDYF